MKEKTEKGFELAYWKLSYRRKFLRTLWFTAAIPLLFLFPPYARFIGIQRDDFFWVLLVVLIVQAAYTYWKWKKVEGAGA